jgi:hypothetical protein
LLEILRSLALKIENFILAFVLDDCLDNLVCKFWRAEGNIRIAADEYNFSTWDLAQPIFMAVRLIMIAFQTVVLLAFTLTLEAWEAIRAIELATFEGIPGLCIRIHVGFVGHSDVPYGFRK